MLIHKVDHSFEDAELFVGGNLPVAQRHRSKDAYLLNEHLQRIFITFEWNLGGLENVPVLAPDQANQLREKVKIRDVQFQSLRSLTVAPKDQISVGAPQRRLSMASGLRNIAAPMIWPSSNGFALGPTMKVSPQSPSCTSLKRSGAVP